MRKLVLLGICVSAIGAASDAPYAGKWKMNAEKSNFGESTMTYEQLPGGQMKATMDGMSFTFKTDGSDAMTPWGMTQATKAIDSKSWEIIEKTNGKVSATSKMVLSDDGKMLTLNSKRVKADGGASDDAVTFERVSGGPGLAGKWKTKKMTSSSPDTLALTPRGSDGLAIELGNAGAVCDAKFDGKDHPTKGSMFPAGWTCMIAKHGDNAFDVTWKKDGKGMYKSTLTASGKTLTETGSAIGSDEKYSIVYDKQ